jgi:hypothetical protein
MAFGFSISDIGFIIEKVQGFIHTYQLAPHALRTLADELQGWRARLDLLDKTLEQLNKPSCDDFESFRRTLDDGKKLVEKFAALQDEDTNLGRKAIVTARFNWGRSSIKDFTSRVQSHTSAIQMYLMQIMLLVYRARIIFKRLTLYSENHSSMSQALSKS